MTLIKATRVRKWQLSTDHEKLESIVCEIASLRSPPVSVRIFPVYLPTEVDLNHVQRWKSVYIGK